MIDNAAKGCLVAGLVALGLSGPAWSQRAGAQQAEQRAAAEVERREAAAQRGAAVREAQLAEASSERDLAEARRALEEAAREVARRSAEIARPVIRDVDSRFARYRGRVQLGVNVDDAEDGARVIGVTPGSGAADAGLMTGDVITSIDGVTLVQGGRLSPSQALLAAVRNLEPDQGVLVRVLRDGEVHELTVLPHALGFGDVFARGPDFDIELPDFGDLPRIFAMPGMFSRPFRELELVSLTPELGAYFGTDEGLLVVRAPGNEALELEDGDVILDIGGRKPTSPEHAMRILASFEPGEALRLTIMRKQRRETLELAIPGSSATG
jgi:S1-C subfamily serine protease